jgi:hypothetical protein
MGDIAKMNFEPGSWQEALYDVCVGMKVGGAHSMYFVKKNAVAMVNPVLNAFGMGQPKHTLLSPEEAQPLKVIGVGYGRTGTYSLTLALEELGIPTLHTQHLYEHDDIFDMWERQVFQPAVENERAELGSPNFEAITRNGYQATMDFPMALYYEQVHEQFPDCKFILTVRDNSEQWFKSWDMLAKTITEPTRRFGTIPGLKNVKRINTYLKWLFSMVNQDNVYLTPQSPTPTQNKQAAIASYEAHNRRVREIIPADQLLEYSVKEGWEPLCDFLEIQDCPTTPFPKSNSARSLHAQTMFAMILPISIALFITFYLFSATVQRCTGMTVLQWMNRKRIQFLTFAANLGQGKKGIKSC